MLAAALLAAVLGAFASRALDGGWLARTAPVQAALVNHARAGAPRSPRPGDPIPDVHVRDRQGRDVRLSTALAGRPTLVNLWASWCGPCVREMPALDAFSRQQGTNGVQVVGIALDTALGVEAFLATHPVRYQVLVDTPGPADAGVRLGDTRGVLPFSVLVDGHGQVLRQWVGPLTAADLDRIAGEAARHPTHD